MIRQNLIYVYIARWCEEIEHSTGFWKLDPPLPTSSKKRKSACSSTKFLRYIGGKIQRSCIFLFSKSDFDEAGRPLKDTRKHAPYTLPTMDDMKANLSRDQWERVVQIVLKADIPGGCHGITLQTVIDILTFWGAGPNDCILDIGSGMGSTAIIAAVSLGARAVGIEYREDVFSGVLNVISSINGVLNE
jgi:hypothetical protein